MVRHRNRGVWHDTILGEATDGTLGCSVPLAAVLGKCTAQYRGLLDESFTKSEPMLRIMIGPCTKERTGPLHERAKRDGQCYRPGPDSPGSVSPSLRFELDVSAYGARPCSGRNDASFMPRYFRLEQSSFVCVRTSCGP